MKSRRRLETVIITCSIGWNALAHAIDDSSRAAARALVNDGAAEFAAGKYESSLKKFNEALEVAKVPTVTVWAAQANEKLGKWVRAAELYEQALLMQPNELWVGTAQEDAQANARRALEELKPRIPTVRLELVGASGAEVEVTIDSTRVPNGLLAQPRPVDPGTHVIVAKRGDKSATQTISAAASQKLVVALQLAPPSVAQRNGSASTTATVKPQARRSSSSHWQHTAGWVGVGVGATGVVLGTVTGVLVGLKRSSLQSDGCTENTCVGASYKDRISSYNMFRTVSTVGFVVGGIGAAAGVTLLLTSPKSEASPQVSLALGPESIQLMGDF